MPNLQALQAVPSFSSQLGQALGGGISQGISGTLNQMFQAKQNRSALSALAPMLGISSEELGSFIGSGLNPETAIKAAKVGGSKKNISSGIQEAFSTMSQMVAQDLNGIGISPQTAIGIDPSGVQNRAMFDSMRSRMEGALLPLVNKGALSKPRFDFILSQIPKASDRQREIVGKLAGLSKVLTDEGIPIDTSILQQIPWAKEDLSKAGIGKSQTQSSNGSVMMRDPSGALRRVPKKDVIAAQKEGYQIEQ